MTRSVKVLAALTALFLSTATAETTTTTTTTTGLRGRTNHNNNHNHNHNDIETEEEEQQQQHRQLLRQQELAPGTRIIARFKSKRGHTVIRSCAKTVLQDSENSDSDDNNNNNNNNNNNKNIMIIEGSGDCMHRLQHDPDIEEADFDFPVTVLNTNIDGSSTTTTTSSRSRSRSLQEVLPWGMETIRADKVPKGEHDILVCMVDSGIASGHPDFAANSKISGADNSIFFRDNWRWNRDPLGHGTRVAGILAAIGGNGIGVTGAGLNLYVTRGIDNEGRGYESDIVRAIEQCVNAGAKIINLSLGGKFISERARRYYDHVVNDLGVMMISAAGNDGSDIAVYPAAHSSVISVSAIDESKQRYGSSNYGNQIELAAPGHRILTTSVTTSTLDFDNGSVIVDGRHIAGTSTQAVAATLTYCGFGQDEICEGAEENICLMFKLATGENTLESMLQHCQDSKGVGAIIFDPTGNTADDGDDEEQHIDPWEISASNPDFNINIPAMAITMDTVLDVYPRMLGQQIVMGTTAATEDGTVVSYTYEQPSGTSYAAPHVTAAAALVWSHFGTCTNHQIRYALAVSAKQQQQQQGLSSIRRSDNDNDNASCNPEFGYGIVDTKGAYNWLQSHPCDTWDVSEVSTGGCTTLNGELIDIETATTATPTTTGTPEEEEEEEVSGSGGSLNPV